MIVRCRRVHLTHRCKCPESTNSPWWPWPASPETSPHLLNWGLHLSPVLGHQSLSEPCCRGVCCYSCSWIIAWLSWLDLGAALLSPDDHWAVGRTLCCHHPALLSCLWDSGTSLCRCRHCLGGTVAPGSPHPGPIPALTAPSQQTVFMPSR